MINFAVQQYKETAEILSDLADGKQIDSKSLKMLAEIAKSSAEFLKKAVGGC